MRSPRVVARYSHIALALNDFNTFTLVTTGPGSASMTANLFSPPTTAVSTSSTTNVPVTTAAVPTTTSAEISGSGELDPDAKIDDTTYEQCLELARLVAEARAADGEGGLSGKKGDDLSAEDRQYCEQYRSNSDNDCYGKKGKKGKKGKCGKKKGTWIPAHAHCHALDRKRVGKKKNEGIQVINHNTYTWLVSNQILHTSYPSTSLQYSFPRPFLHQHHYFHHYSFTCMVCLYPNNSPTHQSLWVHRQDQPRDPWPQRQHSTVDDDDCQCSRSRASRGIRQGATSTKNNGSLRSECCRIVTFGMNAHQSTLAYAFYMI